MTNPTIELVLNVSDWFRDNGGSSSYEIHNPIGSRNPVLARGAFGELSVAIATCTSSRRWKLAAVKTIAQFSTGGQLLSGRGGWDSCSSETSSTKLSREAYYEIRALQVLQTHPNIVELLDVYPSKESSMGGKAISLAFPYCPVDLYVTQEWRRRSFLSVLSFSILRGIAHDIFSALQHCHANGILHCDIKPGNLLVSSGGYIQLCDFGLARPYSTDQKMENIENQEDAKGLCTLYYRPPELLLGGVAETPAVDTYSAGLVLAELVTGVPLFRGGNVLGQLMAIYDLLGSPNDRSWPGASALPDYGKLKFTEKDPKPLETRLPRALESPGLLSLLQNLIVLDHSRRYTAEEVLNSEWCLAATTHSVIDRLSMRTELIPPSLQETLLLSQPTNNDLSVASKQALDTAVSHRSFLSSIYEWKEVPASTPSINHRCFQLCSELANQ